LTDTTNKRVGKQFYDVAISFSDLLFVVLILFHHTFFTVDSKLDQEYMENRKDPVKLTTIMIISA
jgi:hypothetical protein